MSATHSIRALLAWARAPEEVIAWAGGEPLAARTLEEVADDARPLLDRAPTARAAVWVLAVVGVPLDVLSTSVAMVLEERAKRFGEPRLGEAIEAAQQMLVDPDHAEGALVHAKRCELIAEQPAARDGRTYRDSKNALAGTALAVAALVRATEAVSAYEARMEAARMDRARATAGRLGLGVSAAVSHQVAPPPTLLRPLAIDVEAPDELVFASEHLGLAMLELEDHEDRERLRDELLDTLADDE